LEFDQFTGNLTLCIPYAMVEPVKAKLYSGYQSEHLEVDQSWVERFLNRLKNAEVEMVVELGRCQIMVQDLLNLKIGDIIPLEKDITLPLVARVEGVPKFWGKAGVCGENRAFQVEERIRSH
jgi:flagellar motor switch protein FliM